MKTNFGLSPNAEAELKEILKDSMKFKKTFSIFVFGSRASGKHKKYSDIDLWIDCEPELDSRELNLLRERCEESNLPIKVDILTAKTCLKDYEASITQEKRIWFKDSESNGRN
ncbi:MAG: nucleotidyltransferase domain-containing protein [Deltaproteobacteria bacterium]|jgi:predicted nucleotidyltransferase|nr:nucleotidyltransferase domain-containing protein [Deltaproteobacteria bacterium]